MAIGADFLGRQQRVVADVGAHIDRDIAGLKKRVKQRGNIRLPNAEEEKAVLNEFVKPEVHADAAARPASQFDISPGQVGNAEFLPVQTLA